MLGAKVSNLLLAEKNLIDFVDKNLGQERDRLAQNELELDMVCHHMVGGILDYPAAISHDLCDITTAWDIYIEAFMKSTAQSIPTKFGHGIYERKMEKNERMLKMPFRGDELSQKQFLNAITHSGLKIRNHIVECTEECIQSGRLENLYVIISNVVMVRNYLWIFQEIFDLEPKSKLKSEYKEISDLVEVVSEQLIISQANLLTTYILHDEISNESWSSHHAYFEGMRGSPIIPMWAYFLRGVQRDTWKIMPPLLSQRILSILLNDSLGILTARYTQINPTHTTRQLFVCDIVNILAVVEELLFYTSSDLSLLCGEADPAVSKIIFSIHMKCHCLVTSLIIVGCPLEILYKTFRRGLSSCSLLERKSAHSSGNFVRTVWMKILSSLTPPKFSCLHSSCDWKLLYHLKLLEAQPAPNWPLTYKVLTMNNRKLANFILMLFATCICPSMDFLLEGKSFKRCGNSACMSEDCHGLPKTLANQNVSMCVYFISSHTLAKEFVVEAYQPILSIITDWSVMDKSAIWTSTTNKPVWFTCLLLDLLPVLKTCVQSVCLNFANSASSRPLSNLQQSEQGIIELLNTVTELLSMVPRHFFTICQEIDDRIPPEFNPVRHNVHVHFLVTALYFLLNLGPKIIASAETIFLSSLSRKSDSTNETNSTVTSENTGNSSSSFPSAQLEQVLLSISERLCHLEDTAFDQAVHRLVSQVESMMRQTEAQLTKKKSLSPKNDFFMTNDIATLKADFLLEDIEGQLSLRVAYWFLRTHGDMLQKVIVSDFGQQEPVSPFTKQTKDEDAAGVQQHQEKKNQAFNKLDPSLLQTAPRIRTYSKPVNTIHEFHYVNKYRTFDEIIWSGQDMDWVNTVRSAKLGLHKAMILKQLERRWEFQPGTPDDVNPSTTTGINRDPSTYKSVRVNKMVEEIKALMTA